MKEEQSDITAGEDKAGEGLPNILKPPIGMALEYDVIAFERADVSSRYDDVYQEIRPDVIAEVRWRNSAYEFVCRNGVSLLVQVVAPGIVRLRYSPDGQFERDFSYAIDPEFVAEKVTVTLEENEVEYLLVSEKLQCVLTKKGMRVRFYDHDDRVICEDEDGFSAVRTIMKGWKEMKISKKSHRREVYYGLGDKSCGNNLAGMKFQLWCTDSFSFGRETDPLYRAIPFYYALHQGLAYGIFLDNTYRSWFDFDSSGQGTLEFWAEGGEIDYYFIYGPMLNDVAKQYARLTGTHALPPIWALGYHQCRWSYYPYSKVMEIAQTFRQLQIPCDAIYLDIDYMDGFRVFTWNYEHFPDPVQLVKELEAIGFHTVVMIDPGIKEDPLYTVYQTAVENNYLVRTADGPVAKAPVWPGFCAFPDFTSPKVREWWGNLYRELYVDCKVSGFWNDMNEPAVFHIRHKTLPDDVLHDMDGAPSSHRRGHNVYGMLMSKASWEGFQRLRPEKRPFLLTRASFAGGQRYAAVWTGDNVSDWEHLQIANVQCQRLSISGISFCGTDIGGFSGDAGGELFVRWLQLAVFHPLMRMHSMGGHLAGDTAVVVDEAQLSDPEMHTTESEPWTFGQKHTDLARKAIELRYCLLPCLYTAFWQHTQSGLPVIRHIAFEDQTDPKLFENDRDFLFGEHILVSPVVQPKINRQLVYLPKGNWYYFWTGQSNSGEVFVNLMPDQIPFFVREGAVLPVYPIRQFTGERPVDELTLYVYYKNGVEISSLYEDAGEGFGYVRSEYRVKTYRTEGDIEQFKLTQEQSGNYMPTYQQVKVYFVGFPTFVRQCTVNGEEQPIKEIRLRDRSLYTLTIKPDFETIIWHG